MYYFNFDVVWRDFDKLIDGLLLGLAMAAVSLLAGCVIGLLFAYARISRWRVLRAIGWFYVEILRNTPILLLAFFIVFGLPELDVTFRNKIHAFVFALAIYAGAYLTEVFRAGLSSVPKAYVEAGKAIGLSAWKRQRYIVLPIMLRYVLPSLGSNLISLFKDTSIATAIAVPELTYYATQINVKSFRVFEVWTVAGGMYLLTCLAIAWLLRRVERRYAVVR